MIYTFYHFCPAYSIKWDLNIVRFILFIKLRGQLERKIQENTSNSNFQGKQKTARLSGGDSRCKLTENWDKGNFKVNQPKLTRGEFQVIITK